MEVKNVLETFWTFGGETSYCILSLIALLFIGCVMNGKNQKYYFGSGVLLFLLCYNELSHKAIMKLGGDATYYRFFWILSMTIVMAVGLCYIWKLYDRMRIKKWLLLLLGLGICLLGGVSYIRKSSFVLPSNAYKIPEEMIVISNVLHEDADTTEDINVLADFDMMLNARQYDASLCLTFGVDTYRGLRGMNEEQQLMYEVVVQKDFSQVSRTEFRKALEEYHVQYVVVEYSEGLDAYLSDCNLTGICPVGIYGIYRVEEAYVSPQSLRKN